LKSFALVTARARVVVLFFYLSFLLLPSLRAFPAGQQTYYVLGNEHQILNILDAVALGEGQAAFIPTPPTGAQSYVGITIPQSGQPIIYDHGEDGYEDDYYNIPTANLVAPAGSGTTEIWGDANPNNGFPPGHPTDVLSPTSVVLLESSGRTNATGCSGTTNNCDFIPLPRTNAIRFGGEDVIFTVGQPINVVHIVFPENTAADTVIGGSLEVFPIESYQASLTYTIPVGVDTYANNGTNAGNFQAFKYVYALVQAIRDNTSVVVDNGTTSVSFVLNRGESWSSQGFIGTAAATGITINQNTTITGDQPIQVGMFTGSDGTFQTRFYNVIPTGLYASEYMSGIYSGSDAASGADVIINNPNPFPISVDATYLAAGVPTTQTIAVPAAAPATFRQASGVTVPSGSAVRMSSKDLFWGIGVYYAGTAGTNGTGGDWGWSLQPNGFLDREIAVPHGFGRQEQVTGGGTTGIDGSPIWVAVLNDDTAVQVDWDGDGVPDQADIDNDGIGDGTVFIQDALESLVLYDPNDLDQTGGVVLADSDFTSSWGYNRTQATQDPGLGENLDWGYTINPFDFRFQQKILGLDKTAIPNSIAPGQPVTFTICATSGTLAPVINVDLSDVLPPGFSYIPNSAIITYPDFTTVQLEPTQSGNTGSGVTLLWDISHILGTNEELCVELKATANLCLPVATVVDDDFNSGGYAGGNNWLTPPNTWTEASSEAPTNATGGQFQIVGNALELRGLNSVTTDTPEIFRAMDLSTFCTPRLSFTRTRTNLGGGGEGVLLEASSDGVNYFLLHQYVGADAAGPQVDTYDLTPFKSATTYIRFRGLGPNDTGDILLIDNLQISDIGLTPVDISHDFTFPSPPAAPTSYQSGKGWAGPWVEVNDAAGGGGTNSPIDGLIRVLPTNRLNPGSCLDSNHLDFDGGENPSGGGVSAEVRRPINLAGFTTPQITLTWDVFLTGGTEFYNIEQSLDGGATWPVGAPNPVFQWGPGAGLNGGGCRTSTFNLNPAANMIRFIGGGGLDSIPSGSADTLVVDNIKILDGGAPTAPKSVENCGVVTGVYKGFGAQADDCPKIYFSNFQLTKEANSSTIEVGQTLIYTIKVKNVGPQVENNLELRDPVPAFASLQSISPISATGVPAPSYTVDAKTVSWGLFSLAVGEERTYTMTVVVNTVPFDGTPVKNTATLFQEGKRELSATEVVTGVNTPIFLQIFKNAPGSVRPSGLVTYSFNLFNTGVAGATGAVLTDRIPREAGPPVIDTAYVVGSASPPGIVQLSTDGVDFTYSPGGAPGTIDITVTHVRFNIGSIAAGAHTTAAFTVRETGVTPLGTTIRNFGFLTNNETTVRVTNITETVIADISLDIAADKSLVCPTDQITYELTVDGGGSTFTTPIVTMPIPNETTLTGTSVAVPANWSVKFSTDDGITYTSAEPGDPTTVDFLQFLRGSDISTPVTEVMTFTVDVVASPTVNTDIIAKGTLNAVELTPALNSNELFINVLNLRIQKSANVSLVDPAVDGKIKYTLRLDNFGSVPSTGTKLEDPIPANTTLVGSPSDGGVNLAGVLTWSLGTMPPLSSAVRTFTVTVGGATPGGTNIDNRATGTSQACSQLSNLVQVLVTQPGVTAGFDQSAFGDQGDKVCHPAQVTNTGSLPDIINLTATNDNPAWPITNVSFFNDVDADGTYDVGLDTPLLDSAGDVDLTTDTGTLAASETIKILVCVDIPLTVPDGDQNITTVRAESSNNPALFDTFQDTTQVNNATSVFLTEFHAAQERGGVQVRWRTAQEVQNQGFLVYRSPGLAGPWTKVGCCLIPGSGTFPAPHSYQTFDTSPPPSGPVYYKLIDVDFLGQRRHHPPVGIDRDGDGIPFDQEARYSLSDTDPGDALQDPDGDGVSSGEEIAAGRNPHLAESAPADPLTLLVGDTPPPEGFRLLNQDANHQVLELNLRGYDLVTRTVQNQQTSYPELALPVAGYTETPGRPRLPVVGIHLPPGFTRVKVLEIEEDHEDNVLVGPAPYAQRTGSNLVPRYKFDQDFYQQPPAEYPETVYGVRTAGQLGTTTLVFHPFGYDHQARRLRFRKRIRLEVRRDLSRLPLQPLTSELNPGLAAIPPGPLYRLRAKEVGIYQISGAQLRAAGVNTTGHDPRNLSLYLGGTEVPIKIEGEGDGVLDDGDVVEFFQGHEGDRYAAGEGFFLLLGSSPGLRWSQRAQGATGISPQNDYRHTETIHYREYYEPLPGPEEQDRWVARRDYWASSALSKQYALSITELAPTGNGAVVRLRYGTPVHLKGESFHHHRLRFDGSTIGEAQWKGSGFAEAAGYVYAAGVSNGAHQVGLDVLTDGHPPGAFVPYAPADLSIEYDRLLVATDDVLRYPSQVGTDLAVLQGFSSRSITILDVTQANQPIELTGGLTSGAGPFQISLGQNAATSTDIFAYTSAAAHLPTELRSVNRAGLRNSSHRAGWLAVVPDGWESALAPLVSLRQRQGLDPLVVKLSEVSDEFSSGVEHPQAIRRLLAWARTHWDRSPEYLLLAGDANANPRGYPGLFVTGLPFTSDPALIPTHLSTGGPDFLTKETPDDHWFGRLEGGDSIPEVAVGRLHAKTSAQLLAAAQKIANYATATGAWNRLVLSVADDLEPSFTEFANGALGPVLPGLGIQRYYLGDPSFPNQSTFLSQFHQALEDGSVLMQFVGHGSPYGWTGAPTILDQPRVRTLSNGTKLPIVLSMTCEDGYFGDVLGSAFGFDSLAELMVLNPTGGAAAYHASGVQSSAVAKKLLHTALTEALFSKEKRRIGDAIREGYSSFSANSPDTEQLMHSFNLFGDPATRIRLPNPLSPSQIRVERLLDNRIVVSWDPVIHANLSGYEVWRRLGLGPSVQVAVVQAPPFTDTAQPAGTTVYYTVRATTNDGLGSALPAEVGAATAAVTVSPAPSGGGGGGCNAGGRNASGGSLVSLILAATGLILLRRKGCCGGPLHLWETEAA
jgi:uncharacterized repeat protein (TIGR01451 family)